MTTWFTQSDALGVVTTLFWGSVLTTFACFLTDSYLHALLKTHWKPLLVCLALVLIWRIPTEGGFFHGRNTKIRMCTRLLAVRWLSNFESSQAERRFPIRSTYARLEA